MKRTLFIGIVCLTAMIIAAPLSFADKLNKPQARKMEGIKPSAPALTIADLANSQMYRYGREMYQRGNHAEAVRVFAEMIRLDCHNKIAHYHLQKIADTIPDYAYLKDALKNIPCGTYDFTKEDFLPASMYYKKDPDLILEQLASYHKRQRLSEKDMNEKIDLYNTMVRELELTITDLMRDTPAADGSIQASPTEDIARLETGRKVANKIEKEIALLKSQMASQQLDSQKEVQDLRTRLAEAEARIASDAAAPQKQEKDPAAQPAPEPQAYSPEGTALQDAVNQAKTELAGKETALAEKEQKLADLQAKFDAIQQKLKIIQDELAKKNIQIQAIQANLQDIQRP